ncbi:endonuclease/exonuclease/phosphatase family protein [Patescibacteria group bacterium]|nr:endonuclease/exonuclease/phosphatase family protein [Patescibacteria group bacterium]
MAKRALPQKLNLLYLNVGGGQWFEELMEYISSMAEHIDVFCFQEVLDTPTDIVWSGELKGRVSRQRADLFKQLRLALPEYFPLFAWYSRLRTVDFPLYIGNAMFIKRGGVVLDVCSWGDTMVFGRRDGMDTINLEALSRNVQYAVLKLRGKAGVSVFNFHGLWQPIGKKDTPRRLRQFQELHRVVEAFPGSDKILGGDFNTFPTSRCSLVLEEAGMRNLVRECGILSTRSSLYKRPQNGPHADNIFISGGGTVQLEVPEVLASDHLPLVVQYQYTKRP